MALLERLEPQEIFFLTLILATYVVFYLLIFVYLHVLMFFKVL